MNTKDNQRTRLTKRLLTEALFDLMESGMSVDKISVKKLCDAAEISRSTFYLHYENPTDILTEVENALLKEYEEYERMTYSDGVDNLQRNITSFVRFLRKNELFGRLICNTANPGFARKCFETSYKRIQSLDMGIAENARDSIYAYIAEGAFGFFKTLFTANASLPDETAAEIMLAMSKGALAYAMNVYKQETL